MIQLLKNFARSILALPYDGGIFQEKCSDTIEKWQWARTHSQNTVVIFYSETCLASELLLRTMIALEADLRNKATIIYLADSQDGVADLRRSLGVERLPQTVLADHEGLPLRRWGTKLNPMDVLETARRAAAQRPKPD